MSSFLEYVPGTSPLHRMNPVAKLAAAAAFALACFCSSNLAFLAVLLAAGFALAATCGMVRPAIGLAKAVFAFSLILAVVQVLTTPSGAVLVDGDGELYTKSAARELVFAANQAGCAFMGAPLVEATGSLQNFKVRAMLRKTDCLSAYTACAAELVARLMSDAPPAHRHPRLMVLHASNRKTSNTIALWERMAPQLEGRVDTQVVNLRNGTVADCNGCEFRTCLHFGEEGRCFYGGVIVDEVYPAITQADGVLWLCPNYNDALAANLTACINRLTALFRTTPFYDKELYGIIVSGYSGGDIVAQQLISALCMNKAFRLPPRFCLLETANDAGAAVKLPGIDRRLADFAAHMFS